MQGKKEVPRKAVRELPAERAYTEGEFLSTFKRGAKTCMDGEGRTRY
nr:hypothetical protein [Allomuricauda sp.]